MLGSATRVCVIDIIFILTRSLTSRFVLVM